MLLGAYFFAFCVQNAPWGAKRHFGDTENLFIDSSIKRNEIIIV